MPFKDLFAIAVLDLREYISAYLFYVGTLGIWKKSSPILK